MRPTPAELQAIENALSLERLQPYIRKAGNLEQGIQRYAKDVQVAQGLYPVLHVFEVALRNSVHAAFSGPWGANWFYNRACPLSRRESDDVLEAVKKIQSQGRHPSPGRIVSELNLGFWTNLFDKQYEMPLWTPHRKTIFPYAWPTNRVRSEVHADLKGIRDIRNRVFHYEPVTGMAELIDAYCNAHKFVAWIDPATHRWLCELDRFANMYKRA